MSKHLIREVNDGDWEEILCLAQELVIHCEMPDGVHTTPNVLQRDRKLYECLVAEEGNIPDPTQKAIIGYALFTYSFDTRHGKIAMLQELYVTPPHRGRGVGTKLMQHVAKMILANGCTKLFWCAVNSDIPTITFYNRIGGGDLTKSIGIHYYKMNQTNLQQLAIQL